MLLFFFAAGLPAGDDEQKAAARARVAKNFDGLVKTVEQFRLAACANTPAAVIRHAQENTGKKIEALEKTLCPTSNVSRGWNCFFNTSIYSLVCLNRQTALAAFYHPWSDVFLMTVWKEADGVYRMADAELVMGDLIRKKGKPPFDAMPQWLGSPLPLPTAAALVTAQTLRAMHKLFPAQPDRKKAVDWRGFLPCLNDDEIMNANRLTVGVLFERNLVSINAFFKDAQSASVCQRATAAIERLKRGAFEEVMAGAPETLPESKKLLAELKPQDWNGLSVVSFASTSLYDFVFLSSGGKSEIYVSFWFKKEGTDVRLRQVDIFNHHVCFQKLDQLERVVASALKKTPTGKKS